MLGDSQSESVQLQGRTVLLGKLLSSIPFVRARATYVVRHPRMRQVAVPVSGGRGLRHFWRFEDETFAILSALIKLSPGVFVDIGANIGQTLVKAKSVDTALEYVGFEPSPASYAYTDELIQLNRFRNCTLIPMGVSDRQGVVELHFSHPTDAAATTVAGFWTGKNRKPYQRRILVERADVMIRKVTTSRVGVVKIDIEGGELEALKGLDSIVAEDMPPIVMEVLPASCDLDASFSDTPAGVQLRLERIAKLGSLLKDLALTPFRLMPNGTLQEVDSFDRKEYVPELTNYLLFPSGSRVSLRDIESGFGERMAALPT
jgi:FkbM family methyltransferase